MIVSVAEFEKYNGVDDKDEGFLWSMIRSAEEVTANYLGYRPEYQLRQETHDGHGRDYLLTRARPIQAVSQVTIEDVPIPLKHIGFEADKIFLKAGIFPVGRRNIGVRYTAGYEFFPSVGALAGGMADGGGAETFTGGNATPGDAAMVLAGGNAQTFNAEPAFLIKNVVLRIASLMLTETGQNIGITSKAFGDSGTRTFINNTDYAKYLVPIAQYKLLVI
jgi:hypothetical protein